MPTSRRQYPSSSRSPCSPTPARCDKYLLRLQQILYRLCEPVAGAALKLCCCRQILTLRASCCTAIRKDDECRRGRLCAKLLHGSENYLYKCCRRPTLQCSTSRTHPT